MFFKASLFGLVFTSLSLAQNPKVSPGSQLGLVVGEVLDVYAKADFDSPVIAQVERGKTYAISLYPVGPFYKIRVKPGQLGWIPDTEVRPLKAESGKKKSKEVSEKPPKPVEKAKRSLLDTRYRGPAVEFFQWIEDTMGDRRQEVLPLYGFNWSGYDTMFSGETYTSAQVLVGLGAPKYYERLTGKSSSGWIIKMNFSFLTPSPQGKNHMVYYGFGPSFTYSHFDVGLRGTTKDIRYSLDDMSLGVFFDLGVALRFGDFSPRVSVKYYFEKKQHLGAQINLLFPF